MTPDQCKRIGAGVDKRGGQPAPAGHPLSRERACIVRPPSPRGEGARRADEVGGVNVERRIRGVREWKFTRQPQQGLSTPKHLPPEERSEFRGLPLVADASSILHPINKRRFSALSWVVRCEKPLTDGAFGRALEHGEPIGCLGVGYLSRTVVEHIEKHLNGHTFRRDAEVQVHLCGWEPRRDPNTWNLKVDQACFVCRWRGQRCLNLKRKGDKQDHSGISTVECGWVMAAPTKLPKSFRRHPRRMARLDRAGERGPTRNSSWFHG